MAETFTQKHERSVKELFVGNCWQYLHDNFHKFNETNKIKIALTLVQKDMPTQLDGKVSETIINIIKAQTAEERPKESIVENGRRLSINV